MQAIVLIAIMAIITEALVEYGKTVGRAVIGGEWKTAVTQLAAILLGVFLCFATGADLFAWVGVDFAWKWVGVLVTGVIASRGSNYVSDIVKKLQAKKEGD